MLCRSLKILFYNNNKKLIVFSEMKLTIKYNIYVYITIMISKWQTWGCGDRCGSVRPARGHSTNGNRREY